MLAKAHSSSTRLGARRTVALAATAAALAFSSTLVIATQASAADPVTGRLAALAAKTTHELSATVDGAAAEATANVATANVAHVAEPETAAEPETPMQQAATSDPTPTAAAVERSVQTLVSRAPETTARDGSPPSAAIGAQSGAQAGAHAIAMVGAVHVASGVAQVTGELRRTGRSGLAAVVPPVEHVLARLAPTARVVQALTRDPTTLVGVLARGTLARAAVQGLTSISRTALTPAESIGRATTSALSFPLLSTPAPHNAEPAGLVERDAFTAVDLLRRSETTPTGSVDVRAHMMLTLARPSEGLLLGELGPDPGLTKKLNTAALSPLTTSPPARAPTPSGVSGATEAGPGAGISVSIFLTLAGLLMLALPRAMRHIRLTSAPWRVTPFALIPARPG